MYRESLTMRRKLLGGEHPETATTLHNLAGVLMGQNKLAQAEAMYREALVMIRKSLGNGQSRTTRDRLARLRDNQILFEHSTPSP